MKEKLLPSIKEACLVILIFSSAIFVGFYPTISDFLLSLILGLLILISIQDYKKIPYIKIMLYSGITLFLFCLVQISFSHANFIFIWLIASFIYYSLTIAIILFCKYLRVLVVGIQFLSEKGRFPE